MSERHPHARLRQRGDEAGRRLFRRQRDQGDAAAKARESLEIADVRTADRRRIVHAGPGRRQERALQMDAEDGGIERHRLTHGRDRRRHLARLVGDEGRQQRRRAETPVSGRDRTDACGRRLVVEEHVAAAVDLHVDEARREPHAVRHRLAWHGRRQLVRRHQGGDPRAVQDHGVALPDAGAVEDGVGGDRVRRGGRHRVRVTFCRWRGRSTSMPRRSASRTASP